MLHLKRNGMRIGNVKGGMTTGNWNWTRSVECGTSDEDERYKYCSSTTYTYKRCSRLSL
jgi:hypothetical protein